MLATNKTIDFKTRTVEDLSDTLSVLFYLHPTRTATTRHPTILCGTHRQFATDETRASVVAFLSRASRRPLNPTFLVMPFSPRHS